MLETKSNGSPAKKIVIVIVCIVVMAGALFIAFGAIPVLGFRAGMYAREVADRSGDRGQAAKNLLALGVTALPYATDMLKSEDYTTRKYGISIIKQLRENTDGHEHDAEFEKAANAIVDMLPREDIVRNRTEALVALARLCYGRCQYAARLMRYFDDPADEVRSQMGGTMQAVINQYLPDHDTQWWKDFYEQHKAEFEKQGKLIQCGKIPPLGSEKQQMQLYQPSAELSSPDTSSAETPTEAPAQVPTKAPGEAPAEAPAEVPVEVPVEVPTDK